MRPSEVIGFNSVCSQERQVNSDLVLKTFISLPYAEADGSPDFPGGSGPPLLFKDFYIA